MTKNDGGPAFANMTANSCGPVNPRRDGMSLRDWFAGQADLTGYSFESAEKAAEVMGIPPPKDGTLRSQIEFGARLTAALCYLAADAMIAERAK